jgi:predicted TIM-barrel fold metal-dependent hydrolase
VYKGTPVIDVHGHLSTPQEFSNYSTSLLHLRKYDGRLQMSDEALEVSAKRHLGIMDERNIDFQLLSNRPVHMWHWETPEVQEAWCRAVNDTIAQKVRLHPDRFAGMAQLPQNVDTDTSNCVAELERCVNEYGFVGAIVNPDPGADHKAPGMQYEYWYPLYKKAEELQTTLMIHASIWRDPRLKGVPHNYQINNFIGQFLATLALENSTVFETFPNLKIFVCHCGGALNRFAPEDTVHVYGNAPMGKNLMFDTCAYDADFLALAIKQRGADRFLFGTEAPGSGGRAIRKSTGRPSDDLVPVIDGFDFLTEDQKLDIFNRNARKFFPLLKEVREPALAG